MSYQNSNNENKISITSHVSRDFLQNAAYFSTLSKVIWEYVSNSLDNAKDNLPLNVIVDISKNKIVINDNGIGMSREGLRNFFTMHGENIRRKTGKRVRGRFGTGKCAAFGIANSIIIDTVNSYKRNVVRLDRKDIESVKDGAPVPIRDIVEDQDTDLEDGTSITIENLNINTIDQINSSIQYIERHLSRYKNVTVTINNQRCEYREPIYSSLDRINSPDGIKNLFGDIELILKVSPTPLDKETRGVDILSNGIWHETTLAGLEGKEFANFIFGEIEVPLFEEKEDWKIPPFDNTRNNTLNKQNPYVVTLLGWISNEIEKKRNILIEEDKKRKKTIEAKKLKKEAEKIASILNEDFIKLLEDFELAKEFSIRRGRTKLSPDPSSIYTPLPGDGDELTGLQTSGQPHGDGKRGETPPGPGDEPRPGPDIIEGDQKGKKKPASSKGKRRKRGIFSIEYRNESPESNRSRYDSEQRVIIINLDHPQIHSIYLNNNKNVESRNFREISYELAIVEYALAIPFERIKIDELYDASDALFDTRETINRLSRKISEVIYSAKR